MPATMATPTTTPTAIPAMAPTPRPVSVFELGCELVEVLDAAFAVAVPMFDRLVEVMVAVLESVAVVEVLDVTAPVFASARTNVDEERIDGKAVTDVVPSWALGTAAYSFARASRTLTPLFGL